MIRNLLEIRVNIYKGTHNVKNVKQKKTREKMLTSLLF